MDAPRRPRRGALAEAMPAISSWVANMRLAFGDAHIDDVVLRGRKGEAVFYAAENGISFGTKSESSSNVWSGEGFADRRYCAGCDGGCIGSSRRCSKRRQGEGKP